MKLLKHKKNGWTSPYNESWAKSGKFEIIEAPDHDDVEKKSASPKKQTASAIDKKKE
ncbi:hypothetical protein [Desulfovibrio inopinatus]|uniref:hypothetical protein n=1 Tax=Desulfovibrio inopinatus TaxID=102109 RepID=UPI00041C301C|nr:hypothetical protein [Desulfovibrio inopinatus]